MFTKIIKVSDEKLKCECYLFKRNTLFLTGTIFLRPGTDRSKFSRATEATHWSIDRFPFPVSDPKRLTDAKVSLGKVCRAFARVVDFHGGSRARTCTRWTDWLNSRVTLLYLSLSLSLSLSPSLIGREFCRVRAREGKRCVPIILSASVRNIILWSPVLRTPCRFHSGKKLTTTARRFSTTCLRRLSVAREPERDGSERAAGSGRTAISPDIEARA